MCVLTKNGHSFMFVSPKMLFDVVVKQKYTRKHKLPDKQLAQRPPDLFHGPRAVWGCIVLKRF